MSCSAPSFLKQTAWPKPHSHTLCHLGKPQPSAGQCDPLQNQWEVWGAPGCGAQRPTSWVGHCLNKLVGNTESGHQFTPKGVKHIVMARGRCLSLLNTLAMNILPMLGTLLNERKRRDMPDSPGLCPFSGQAFSPALQPKHVLKPSMFNCQV